MSDLFEAMCSFILEMGTAGRLGAFISAAGKWRGADPVKKGQTDIDVVGLNAFPKETVLEGDVSDGIVVHYLEPMN